MVTEILHTTIKTRQIIGQEIFCGNLPEYAAQVAKRIAHYNIK